MTSKTLAECYSLSDTLDHAKKFRKIYGFHLVSFETTRIGYRVFLINTGDNEESQDTNLSEHEENEDKNDENVI